MFSRFYAHHGIYCNFILLKVESSIVSIQCLPTFWLLWIMLVVNTGVQISVQASLLLILSVCTGETAGSHGNSVHESF